MLGDIKRHGAAGFVQVQDRAGGDGAQGNAFGKWDGERRAAKKGFTPPIWNFVPSIICAPPTTSYAVPDIRVL